MLNNFYILRNSRNNIKERILNSRKNKISKNNKELPHTNYYVSNWDKIILLPFY